MEVLLLADVLGVGKRHEIKVVSDGFALNTLLPGQMALVATPTVRERYAAQIAAASATTALPATAGNVISPDTYALMVATLGAGYLNPSFDFPPEPAVKAADAILKATGMTVGDYRNFIPA